MAANQTLVSKRVPSTLHVLVGLKVLFESCQSLRTHETCWRIGRPTDHGQSVSTRYNPRVQGGCSGPGHARIQALPQKFSHQIAQVSPLSQRAQLHFTQQIFRQVQSGLHGFSLPVRWQDGNKPPPCQADKVRGMPSAITSLPRSKPKNKRASSYQKRLFTGVTHGRVRSAVQW